MLGLKDLSKVTHNVSTRKGFDLETRNLMLTVKVKDKGSNGKCSK